MANISIPQELLDLNPVELVVEDMQKYDLLTNFVSGPEPVGYKAAFHNGWTASIQRHPGTYGYEVGLWEVAHQTPTGDWDWDTLGTGDVLGFLTWEEVLDACRQISEL